MTTSTISNGQATSSGYVVSGGNTLVVNSGGTAISATVSSGGYLSALSGAHITGTTVLSGGFFYVVPFYEVVTSTTLFGSMVVSAGDSAYFTDIKSGGTETIASNGKDFGAIIEGGGKQFALYNTVVSGAIIESGGFQDVYSSGTASNTVIQSGGVESLSGVGGGKAVSTTVQSGGTLLVYGVYGGSLASGTTVSSGGVEVVFSGGTTSNTTVLAGGILIELPGAKQSGTFKGSATTTGVLTLPNNSSQASLAASLNGSAIVSGGVAYGLMGGVLANDTVYYGGSATLASGASAQNVTLSGGSLIVSSGGSTTGTQITTQIVSGFAYGGSEFIVSGATATGTVVFSKGGETVSAGGSSLNPTISSGGHDTVVGTVTSAIVFGSLGISNSGTATGTTVESGGVDVVSGTAIDTTVLSGGVEFVGNPSNFAGGTTSNTIVSSGGIEFVYGSGTATNLTVEPGGTLVEIPGATVSTVGAVTPFSGVAIVSNNQVQLTSALSGGTVSGGVTVYVVGGASVTSEAISSSTVNIYAGGSDDFSVLSNSTNEYLYSGAVASHATLTYEANSTGFAGAGQTVEAGAIAISTFVEAFGSSSYQSLATQSVYGTAIGTIVSSGYIEVYSGGLLENAVIGSGGSDSVNSLGTATGTLLSSGAGEYIFSGGIAISTTVLAGATQSILYFNAGLTSGTILYGLENVGSAGSAVSTIVESTGRLTLSGSATSALVESGGLVTVSNGGTSIATTILSGGAETVLSMGSATGTIVSNGGNLTISSGALVSGTLVMSGGTETLAASGTADASVTIQYGGSLDLAFLAYNSADVVSFNSNTNTLEVTSGAAAFSTQLNGSYGSASFSASADSAGHVLLTEYASYQVISGAPLSGVTLSSGDAAYVYSGAITSAITVLSGGAEYVYSAGTANGTVVSSGGTIDIASAATVTGLDVLSGGFIDVTSLAYNSADQANVTPGGLLTVVDSDGTTVFTEQLAGSYTGDYFHLALDSGGTGTLLTENTTPCYCPGTLIATDKGEVVVETLAIGDRVLTHSGEMRAIKWIGKRSYGGRFVMGKKEILPIRIHANALADHVPARDLWVSPHHALYLNGVLIEAKDLVNGVSIVQVEHVDKIEYFHVELDSHDVILAEGAWAESFIDDDSRGMFHNAHEFAALYPHEQPMLARYYAPRLEDGYEVERARATIAFRAGLAGAKQNSLGGLRGQLDAADRRVIEGWAQNMGHPDVPVCLDIVIDGVVVMQALANLYRPDLARAGIGTGHHSFKAMLPAPLSSDAPHVIEVRRSADGVPLLHSRQVLKAARSVAA